jgi:hypothetical protein
MHHPPTIYIYRCINEMPDGSKSNILKYVRFRDTADSPVPKLSTTEKVLRDHGHTFQPLLRWMFRRKRCV